VPLEQSGYRGELFATQVGLRHRNAQRRLGVGDQVGRQILCGQLGFVECRVGDLQHAQHLAVGAADQEVLVLLAA
jgi:hypothetical protein